MAEAWVLIVRFEPGEKDDVIARLIAAGVENFVEGSGALLMEPEEDVITVYTASPEETQTIRARLQSARATVETAPLEDDDWATAWKRHWKPVTIADRLFVAPHWLDAQTPPGLIRIAIDTTLAFGTGAQETTQIALSLLVRALGDAPEGSGGEAPGSRAIPDSLYDVGCGSGILAIAARKLGVPRVGGLDNDPTATETSIDNAARNGLDDIAFETRSADAIPGTHDIVICNMISSRLDRFLPHLHAAVAPGGQLILSGILLEEWDAFSARHGLGDETLTETRGDWIGALL